MFEITLKFLEAVSKNNSTQRLHTYRDLYQQEKKRFEDFVKAFLEEIKKINPSLEELTPKDCIYRFNKDLRFSKDQKPYKENFWACFAPGGKKARTPCFYFHLQPGDKSFIAGGVYYPSQINENKVRLHILEHLDQRRTFQKEKKLMKFYTIETPDHQYKTNVRLKQLIQKNYEIFEKLSSEDKLLIGNSLLKAYLPERNPLLEQLAYYKDRLFFHPFKDTELQNPDLLKTFIKAYQLLSPVLRFFEEAYEREEK